MRVARGHALGDEARVRLGERPADQRVRLLLAELHLERAHDRDQHTRLDLHRLEGRDPRHQLHSFARAGKSGRCTGTTQNAWPLGASITTWSAGSFPLGV
jgi:hypothetical protein